MLISVRSTNGGGKSTVVKGILDQGKPVPIYGLLGPKRPEAYRLTLKGVKQPTYVLGPYHVASGGCDQIHPYDGVLDLLEKYGDKGNIIFEGVIVSSSYGRVGRLMETYGQEAVMAFLTTSLEDCIKNVQTRRGAAENLKPFNPKNLTVKYNQIVRSKEIIREAGKMRVVELEPATAIKQVLTLLKEAP